MGGGVPRLEPAGHRGARARHVDVRALAQGERRRRPPGRGLTHARRVPRSPVRISRVFAAQRRADDPAQSNRKNSDMSSTLYDIPVNAIDGSPTTLRAFKGKVLLVVNVASK